MKKKLSSNKVKEQEMKKVDENINREIDQILKSGTRQDSIHTTPFFATRIIGKVEQLEDDSVWFPSLSMILRPVLVLLVIVNVVNFYIYNQNPDSDVSNENSIELAMNDYSAWNNDFILSDDLIYDN